MPRWKLFALLVPLAGCDPDAWHKYELYFQVDGEREYESGAPVCQVGSSRRHVIYVAGTTTVAQGGACYGPNDAKAIRFVRNSVPAVAELQTAEVPPMFSPVHVDGDGDDLVAIDPRNGLAAWHTGPYDPARPPIEVDVPVLRGVVRPIAERQGTFLDVAVRNGVAWAIEGFEDRTALLWRVELAAAFDGAEDASLSFPIVGQPVALDVLGDGAIVATTGARSTIFVVDGAGAALGEVDLERRVDGVKVGNDVAWVTAEGGVFALDVADPGAPVFVDLEGTANVDGADTVYHADGDMFFLASGLDTVSMAWDGSRPDRPKAVGGFHVGNGTFDVDTRGQVLLLATGTHGLQFWGPWRDWAALEDGS